MVVHFPMLMQCGLSHCQALYKVWCLNSILPLHTHIGKWKSCKNYVIATIIAVSTALYRWTMLKQQLELSTFTERKQQLELSIYIYWEKTASKPGGLDSYRMDSIAWRREKRINLNLYWMDSRARGREKRINLNLYRMDSIARGREKRSNLPVIQR